MAHTVNTFYRVNSSETTQHTVHCQTLDMIMFQIIVIPIQYGLTQKRKLYQVNLDFIYLFPEIVNLFVTSF